MLGELDRLIAQDASLRVLIDECGLRPSIFGPGDIGRFANRMFQGLANAGDHVGVFHSRADALAWLDGALVLE